MRTVAFVALLLTTATYGSLVMVAHAATLRVPYDYASLTEACNAAQPGDSVAVYPGTYYNEHPVVPPGVSIVGKGANPEQVRVVPSGWDAFGVSAGVLPVLIENLTAYEGSETVVFNMNSSLLVSRCHLIGTYHENIITTLADLELRECWIEFTCWGYGHMIVTPEPVNVLVEDCVIVGLPWQGWCPSPGCSLEFRNNTFIGGVSAWVRDGCTTDFSLFFVNNIMTWGAGCGTRDPDTIEWRHNDFVDSDQWPWCGYRIGNFSEDPLFCDPDEEDYRLDPDSPCIGTGEDGEDVGARLGICWPQDIEGYLPQRTGDLLVSGPWPNPTTTGVSLAIAGVPAGVMRAEIFDAAGTYIQSLPVSSGSDSSILYRWNGRIADGSPAPSGVYYLRINGAAEKISRRVIVLR